MTIASEIASGVGGHYGSKFGGYLGRKIGYRKFGKFFGGLVGAVGAKAVLGSFKKGGRVKKTGVYLLHAGERVIPVRKRKRSK